jgi:hypothetical protein
MVDDEDDAWRTYLMITCSENDSDNQARDATIANHADVTVAVAMISDN